MEAETAPPLRNVSMLADWSLSSCKPGFGIDKLLDGSPSTFWQSDGSQPHTITLQFPHRLPLVSVALLLDYHLDESYTPLKMSVGVGSDFYDLQRCEHLRVHIESQAGKGTVRNWEDLQKGGNGAGSSGSATATQMLGPNADASGKGTVTLEEPQGWITLSLVPPFEDHHIETKENDNSAPGDAGYEEGGDKRAALRERMQLEHEQSACIWCHCVQLTIYTNHQNGKDSHVRGLKVFARDTSANAMVRSMGMSNESIDLHDAFIDEPSVWTTLEMHNCAQLR